MATPSRNTPPLVDHRLVGLAKEHLGINPITGNSFADDFVTFGHEGVRDQFRMHIQANTDNAFKAKELMNLRATAEDNPFVPMEPLDESRNRFLAERTELIKSWMGMEGVISPGPYNACTAFLYQNGIELPQELQPAQPAMTAASPGDWVPPGAQAAPPVQQSGTPVHPIPRAYPVTEPPSQPAGGRKKTGFGTRIAVGVSATAFAALAGVGSFLGLSGNFASYNATPSTGGDPGTSAVAGNGAASGNYGDVIASSDGKGVVGEVGNYTGPVRPKTEAGMQQAIRDAMARGGFDTLTIDVGSGTNNPADVASALAAVRDMPRGSFSEIREVLVENVQQKTPEQVKVVLDQALANNPGTQFDATVTPDNNSGNCAVSSGPKGGVPRTDARSCNTR